MGKFSSNNRENPVDIYTVLAQREAAGKKKPGSAPSMPRMAPAPQAAAPRQNAQPAAPRQDAQPAAQPRQKRSVKGTLTFWLCCLAFIFLFYVGTFVGLSFLRDWLVKFEAAQPTVKCQQVFQELFADPDWEELYSLSGMDSSGYEGSEAFAEFMEQKVGDTQLTFLETSAGLSGDKKYVVWMDEEKLATFTLEDKNNAQGMTAVPDWQLSDVTFFLEGQSGFRIVLEEGAVAHVNGVALSEDHVIARRTSRSEEYIPTFASRTRLQVLEVTGLLTRPQVEILGKDGQSAQVIYDEATATFTQDLAAPEMPQERKELALNSIKTYALYMSGKAGRADVGKYFDKNSDTYAAIMDADLNWVQTGSDYTFTDEKVTDYCVYGEDIFSARVSVNLNITRKEDGSVRENDITQSMFFAKNSSGDWVCYEMTAVDATQWIEEVRLTFLMDGQVLNDGFLNAQSTSVSCPVVSAPEGKTFKGWTVEDVDESGRTVLRLVFTPDETGLMTLAPGTVLEPMTLSPLFE